MEGNIKVKVQTKGMIAIRQGHSTVTILPLKMQGFRLGIGRTQCYVAKTRENPN